MSWRAVIGAATGCLITVGGHRAGPTLTLHACRVPGVDESVQCGTFKVFERRDAAEGRMLDLPVVILPARTAPAAPDPVFVLFGGPGQTATEYTAAQSQAWYREHRAVVLLDQRGTGGTNTLDCAIPGDSGDVQGYLRPMFVPEVFRACRKHLEPTADLRYYGTPIAMEDLDDLRRALGYDQINVMGASYGTRAALSYIGRHPEHVRSVILSAMAPFSLKNPLYHAQAAQEALDHIFEGCESQPGCRAAFPDLRHEFQTVLERLATSPVTVTVPHPATGASVSVTLDRPGFAEAMRVLTYTAEQVSRVPLIIHRAYLGDLVPFGRAGLASNYGIRRILRFGMLMSTTCSEDVARITEAEIQAQTAHTYLGDGRVRQESASCHEWPPAVLPPDFATVRRTDVPALLISGYYDPTTPARFGDEVARDYLPNSVHLLIHEGGHASTTPCTDRIGQVFLAQASVKGLDTSCVAEGKLRPFVTRDP